MRGVGPSRSGGRERTPGDARPSAGAPVISPCPHRRRRVSPEEHASRGMSAPSARGPREAAADGPPLRLRRERAHQLGDLLLEGGAAGGAGAVPARAAEGLGDEDGEGDVLVEPLGEGGLGLIGADEDADVVDDAVGEEGAVRSGAGAEEEGVVDAGAGREARELLANLAALRDGVHLVKDEGDRLVEEGDDGGGAGGSGCLHDHVPRLHELEDGPRDLELVLADDAADLADAPRAVRRGVDVGELRLGILAGAVALDDVLIGGDAIAEVAHLVHAPHALHEQRVHRQALARVDAGLVVRVEEEEHPVADAEHVVDDLLRLLAHDVEEALAREVAALDGDLAKAHLRGDGLRRLGDLLLGERAVSVEHLAEPLGVHGGVRADDVVRLEEDGAAVGAVEHHELALPPGLPYERDDVADGARRRDLAGETEDGAVLRVAAAVLADEAHHDEVRRRRHEAERALPRAHALAGLLPYGMSGAGRVDPHELEPLVIHWRLVIAYPAGRADRAC